MQDESADHGGHTPVERPDDVFVSQADLCANVGEVHWN